MHGRTPNSQTLDWTYTTDKIGRKEKEYYPYTIAMDGSDEYHSLLWEYDTASRRTVMSDPEFGHQCADTSGWSGHVEPDDEDDWVFDEPQRWLYAAQGNLRATGRVSGNEIRAGEGEPYFVERDDAGRVARVTYPNKAATNKPEYEYRYTYGQDGRVAQVALVHMENADESKYGPEEYVIQFKYDKAGRLTRKVVRNDSVQDATRYETSYEYDGRGQLTRERVMAWNATDERMEVRQDIRTTYDLGENPTVVDFYDNEGN